MARRTKDAPGRVTTKGGAGRVTPKGGPARRSAPRPAQSAGGRYTEPVPAAYRSSPRWYPYFILAVFVLGILCILLNYLSLLPGFGGASNIYLFVGLGLIVCGFIAATRWH